MLLPRPATAALGHSSCILKVISAHFWHISLSGWTRTKQQKWQQQRRTKQITQHLNGPCRRFRFDSGTEILNEISVAINLTLCSCLAYQIVFTNHTNLWLVPFPLFRLSNYSPAKVRAQALLIRRISRCPHHCQNKLQ